ASYKAACNAISAVVVLLPHCLQQFTSRRRADEGSNRDCTGSGSRPQSRASKTGSSARAKAWPRVILLSLSNIVLGLCFNHWRRRRGGGFAFYLVQHRGDRCLRIRIRRKRADQSGPQFEVGRLYQNRNLGADLMRCELPKI